MERFYQNHLEVACASDSDEDSQYILRNEPSNLTGFVQYLGSNHTFPPIQYLQMPALQYPGGFITNMYPSHYLGHMHAANLLPYGPQYSFPQQPLFQSDPRTYWRGQHIKGPFDGNSHWFRSGNDIYAGNQYNVPTSRVYSRNDGHSFTKPCFLPSSQANANFSALNKETQHGCISHPGCTSGGALVDDGGVQNTYNGENSTQANILQMAQGSMQQNFPLAEDYSLNTLSKGADGDTGYISEDTDRVFEGFDAAMKLVGQDHSQLHHGYNDEAGSESPESSAVSSTWRTLGSVKKAKQKDRRGNTPRNKSPQIRVGNQKVSIPRLDYLKKIKSQLAAWRSRTPTSPIHHIAWDGFDEESEPAGQSCPLCDKDLSYAPTDDEKYEYTDILIDEPPKLPVVAFLSCGHFFHSQCLELNIPEELSADPPCFLCLSYGES